MWYNGITHDSGSCNPGSIPGTPTRQVMKILIRPITENPISLLRRAGYVFQHEENGEKSFVHALASSGYPRFHCYAKLDKLSLTLNLHLDQKKHTYGETTRHHGEYENEGPLKEEALRLVEIFGEKAKMM